MLLLVSLLLCGLTSVYGQMVTRPPIDVDDRTTITESFCSKIATEADCESDPDGFDCTWKDLGAGTGVCLTRWIIPFHICYVIDSSESILETEWELLKMFIAASIDFFDQSLDFWVGVVSFDTDSRVEREVRPRSEPTDPQSVLLGMPFFPSLGAGGGTETIKGVRMCLDSLETARNDDPVVELQILVTITDGKPNGPTECGLEADRICFPCDNNDFGFPGEARMQDRIIDNNIRTLNVYIRDTFSTSELDCLVDANAPRNLVIGIPASELAGSELTFNLFRKLGLFADSLCPPPTPSPTQAPLTSRPTASPLTSRPTVAPITLDCDFQNMVDQYIEQYIVDNNLPEGTSVKDAVNAIFDAYVGDDGYLDLIELTAALEAIMETWGRWGEFFMATLNVDGEAGVSKDEFMEMLSLGGTCDPTPSPTQSPIIITTITSAPTTSQPTVAPITLDCDFQNMVDQYIEQYIADNNLPEGTSLKDAVNAIFDAYVGDDGYLDLDELKGALEAIMETWGRWGEFFMSTLNVDGEPGVSKDEFMEMLSLGETCAPTPAPVTTATTWPPTPRKRRSKSSSSNKKSSSKNRGRGGRRGGKKSSSGNKVGKRRGGRGGNKKSSSGNKGTGTGMRRGGKKSSSGKGKGGNKKSSSNGNKRGMRRGGKKSSSGNKESGNGMGRGGNNKSSSGNGKGKGGNNKSSSNGNKRGMRRGGNKSSSGNKGTGKGMNRGGNKSSSGNGKGKGGNNNKSSGNKGTGKGMGRRGNNKSSSGNGKGKGGNNNKSSSNGKGMRRGGRGGNKKSSSGNNGKGTGMRRGGNNKSSSGKGGNNNKSSGGKGTGKGNLGKGDSKSGNKKDNKKGHGILKSLLNKIKNHKLENQRDRTSNRGRRWQRDGDRKGEWN